MYHLSKRLNELHYLRRRWVLPVVYFANLLLSFHYYFIIYINSSAVSNVVSEKIVGIFYTVASILNIALLIATPRIIRKVGLYRFSLFLVCLELASLLGFAFAANKIVVLACFVGQLLAAPMIWFTLDMYLEHAIKDETATGNARGIFLTVSNIALVISPALIGLVVAGEQFWRAYVLAAIFLIPLLILMVRYFKPISTVSVRQISFLKTWVDFRKNHDLNAIFKAQIILRFFYAWMVIYMPIYLFEHIGFSWSQIGIIFTIMLLPFALFELPLGHLADEKLGEKEIMTVGFVIMGISVLFIPLLDTANIFLWTALLFLTRTGASFVEITSESYFFKHVDGNDADKVSFFRLTGPLSYIATPLIVMAAMAFLPSYSSTFVILGLISLFGLRYSLAIHDTK